MPWEILSLLNFWIWLPCLMGLLGLLWLMHFRFENASLADVGFCGGLFILVLACGLSSHGDIIRRMVVMGMGTVYAFRLGGHILAHRVWNHSEDARYRKFRQLLGNWEHIGMFFYFQLQVPACAFFAGFLCWIMSHPHVGLRWWDGVGVAIFILAVSGEALADHQLEVFRSKAMNKGKTLRTGLWRYSRHPNYFFESLHWCAYVPMTLGLPFSWMAFLWPGLMIASLLWVTGVPWAEAQALEDRGDDYRHYQRTTSVFIPWFPGENRLVRGGRV
jgi:steroid 5-alpha reductase family enzyme